MWEHLLGRAIDQVTTGADLARRAIRTHTLDCVRCGASSYWTWWPQSGYDIDLWWSEPCQPLVPLAEAGALRLANDIVTWGGASGRITVLLGNETLGRLVVPLSFRLAGISHRRGERCLGGGQAPIKVRSSQGSPRRATFPTVTACWFWSSRYGRGH